MKKAISPVIATVILIAVTLAIGIAVAAWVMGVWGGLGGTESLKILPNSTLTVAQDKATLDLSIKNDGTKDARVIGVEIAVGARVCKQSLTLDIKTGELKTQKGISVSCSGLTPGASYTVKLITEAGNVYQTMLVAYSSG